jgi:hypothetical protein
MNPIETEKLLAHRRRHIQLIRKRAVVGCVAVFAAAWGAIGFQLASGHDPALAKNSQAAAVTSTSSGGTKKSASNSSAVPSAGSAATGSATTGSSSTGSAATDSSAAGSSSTSTSQQLAPVTTQQS